MTRSKRMQPIVGIAENREKEAARELGVYQQNLQEQELKLNNLIAYRDEYARQFEQHCGQGLDAVRAHDYRMFLQKLNDAIVQQRETVHNARVASEQKRQVWLGTRTHAQAIDKLQGRYQRAERQQDERRQQQESDECAQRLHKSGDNKF